MKTLTIKNPWAYLIANGIKDIENRTWKTNHRGTLLIHSSKEINFRYGELERHFNRIQTIMIPEHHMKLMKHNKFTNSAIIGSVEVVDCVQNHHSIWAEQDMWHWVLDNPKLFAMPTLNVKGKLSLWEYEMNDHTDQYNKLSVTYSHPILGSGTIIPSGTKVGTVCIKHDADNSLPTPPHSSE